MKALSDEEIEELTRPWAEFSLQNRATLREAVGKFIEAVYHHHDSKPYPQKYGVPYGAFNELHKAYKGQV